MSDDGDVEGEASSSESSGRIPSSSRLSGVPEEDLCEAVNLFVQPSGVDFNQSYKKTVIYHSSVQACSL